MKARRQPLRTCVGCGTVRPKRELQRIVRRPDGAVDLDAKGKLSGRGVYICPAVSCLEAAVRGKRLERALETEVEGGLLDRLRQQLGETQSAPGVR